MHLADFDGHYGPSRRAVLLGFGSVCRGAAHALKGLGVHDITIYTQRAPHLVQNQIPGCEYRRMIGGDPTLAEEKNGSRRPLVQALADYDIILNGSVQDPEHPLMYFRQGEESQLRPGSLIIDVSCDPGMGFPFAVPTTFDDPTFRVGKHLFYGVDHTPSYLWRCASWEISQALFPYLGGIMSGETGWAADSTLDQAVQIQDGKVRNRKILSYQKRRGDYPYLAL
jgi:alanine dehydrogenase